MDNPTTYDLWHERFDGRQDHEKLLGVYTSQERAQKAAELLRDKAGFRDHPNGFEIYGGPLDETAWLEGFASVWGDEEPVPDYMQKPGKRVLFPSAHPLPQAYWALWHRYVDDWDILQQKLIGVYSSPANAEKGLELVRGQPGFCDRPDGFVITQGKFDDTDMRSGFATIRENGRERDEPMAEESRHY